MERTTMLNRIASFALAFALLAGPVAGLLATQVAAAAPVLTETTTIDTPTNDSTPTWEFFSDQAGLIVYYGPCVGDLTNAAADVNTITFQTLADRAYNAGTKYACSVAVVNSDGEFSTKLAVTNFTVDTTAPVLATVTAVAAAAAGVTTDGTPDFIYSSDEAGDVTFGGSCGGNDNTAAIGNNTVALAMEATTTTALDSGTYSDCTITATDAAGNASNVLAVPSFTVELAADVTLDTIGGLAATSPAVASSRRIQVVSPYSGTITQTTASDGCIINPVSLTASQITYITVQWLDATANAYNGVGTDKDCVIELTTTSEANTATASVKALLDAATITDATGTGVTGGSTAPAATANGSTYTYGFTLDEGASWEVTGAGCSADLLGQTGVAYTGANTIEFVGLGDGIYGDAGNECDLDFTDGTANTASIVIPEFTVTDLSAPVISDLTRDNTTVEYPTANVDTDGVLDFTFDVNEAVAAGDLNLQVLGACDSDTLVTTNAGAVVVTDNGNTLSLGSVTPLDDGVYAGCKFRIDDTAGNTSAFVTLPTFTVDSTGPVLTVTSNVSLGENPIEVSITSNEAGTMVLAGAGCTVNGETELTLANGTQQIVLDPLADGALAPCTITPTDNYANASAASNVAGTITATGTPVLSYSLSGLNTDSLSFTFTTSEAGDLTYTGYCSSKTALSAVVGQNTIQLNTLPEGTVVDQCTITLTDADGATGQITLPEFTVTGGFPPTGPAGTVYRFFNKMNGAHLYTINVGERNTVIGLTDEWTYEGMVYQVTPDETTGMVPTYRFFNTENGAHLYTISEVEKDTVQNTLPKFTFEGIKFYVNETEVTDTVPVYRFFNTENGAHLYTISENEKDTVETTLPKFNFEGIKYYVMAL